MNHEFVKGALERFRHFSRLKPDMRANAVFIMKSPAGGENPKRFTFSTGQIPHSSYKGRRYMVTKKAPRAHFFTAAFLPVGRPSHASLATWTCK